MVDNGFCFFPLLWIFFFFFLNTWILSILLFKGFPLFGPNFFFVPKYPYHIHLSRGKIWGQSGKYVSPTKQVHSPVCFQIDLSTYKQLRESKVVVLIYAGGSMLVFCLWREAEAESEYNTHIHVVQWIINLEVLLHGSKHVSFSYSYMLEICRHFRKLKWSMSHSLLSLMMEWIKNLERFLANSNFHETTATQVNGILSSLLFM